MPAQLSKLHVRFIQTQNNFKFQVDKGSQKESISLENLYIKNSSSFYFINTKSELVNSSNAILTFNEKNDYLAQLECQCELTIIEDGSDDYEEGLLFFQQDQNSIKQLVLLTIKSIKEK